MVGRLDKGKFFQKNKRVQKILADFDNYTEADLHKVKLPKWMRALLIEMKIGNLTHVMTTREHVQNMIDNSPAPEQHTHKVYQFIAETQFLDGLEVMEGEYVLVTDDKTVQVAHHEMPLSLFDGKITFIEEVDTISDFWKKKQDNEWERLYPEEPRIEEQQPNTGLFQIKRIE